MECKTDEDQRPCSYDSFTNDFQSTGDLTVKSPAMAVGLENRSLMFAQCKPNLGYRASSGGHTSL